MMFSQIILCGWLCNAIKVVDKDEIAKARDFATQVVKIAKELYDLDQQGVFMTAIQGKSKPMDAPLTLASVGKSQSIREVDNGDSIAIGLPEEDLESSGPVKCGLKNNRNTCYLNAALQVLFRIDPLRELITQSNGAGEVTDLLKGYINSCQFPIVLDPIVLQKLVTTRYPQFTAGKEHDSQEFLFAILSMLREESEQRLPGPNQDKTLDKPLSAIIDLTYGLLETKVVCSINPGEHVTKTPEVVHSLALPIPEGETDLKACLDEHQKKEMFTFPNVYQCDKCKGGVVAEKTMEMTMWPQYLFLSLKRFDSYGNKDDRRVAFTVNFKPGPNYRLLAFTVHDGNTSNSGHYFTYGRVKESGKDNWYLFNDEKVIAVDIKGVLETEEVLTGAYVFVYERIIQ